MVDTVGELLMFPLSEGRIMQTELVQERIAPSLQATLNRLIQQKKQALLSHAKLPEGIEIIARRLSTPGEMDVIVCTGRERDVGTHIVTIDTAAAQQIVATVALEGFCIQWTMQMKCPIKTINVPKLASFSIVPNIFREGATGEKEGFYPLPNAAIAFLSEQRALPLPIRLGALSVKSEGTRWC